MPLAPPVIFTPPSAGGSPSAPPVIFTPPSAGGSPSAPPSVFTAPGAGGSPAAPAAVFTPDLSGANANYLETSFPGTNNDLRFEQVISGTAPTIEFAKAGGLAPTSIAVEGRAISIIVAQSFGIVSLTAAGLKALLDANASVMALVSVSYPTGNDGSGQIEPTGSASIDFGPTALSGGGVSAPAAIFTPPSAGGSPSAPAAIFTPPSAGGSPSAPAAIFTPPGSGGAPSAPSAIFTPPGAGGSPSAPGAIFTPPIDGGSPSAPPAVYRPGVPDNALISPDDNNPLLSPSGQTILSPAT